MIRINLLGREAEEQAKGLRGLALPEFRGGAHQVGMALLLLATIGFIALTWWNQSSRLQALRADLTAVQTERQRLQEVADQVETLRSTTDLLRQKLKVIVGLKANQTGPVMLLDQVSRLLTDGVWLTRLQLEGGDVTIRGAALSEVSVADYVRNLEGSAYFTDVFLRTLGDTGEALSFQISLRFDPLAGRAPDDSRPPKES